MQILISSLPGNSHNIFVKVSSWFLTCSNQFENMYVWIPSWTLLITSLELIKSWLSVLSQVNELLCLTSSQKGSITRLMAYVQATWFTRPNHEGESVIFVGVGKFSIAGNNLSDGVTPDRVIYSPANLTISWQNLNLVLFVAQRPKESHVWNYASLILWSHRQVSSTTVTLCAMSLIKFS